MSYTNESYKEAVRILENRRTENKLELERRRREVYEKIPEFNNLNKKMSEFWSDCAKLIKSDDENIDINIKGKLIDLKNQCSMIIDLKNDLLVKNGFDLNYLNLPANCPICLDKGAVNGKRCVCFEELLKETAYKRSNLSAVMDEQNFSNFELDIFDSKVIENLNISSQENIINILKVIREYIKDFDNEKSSLLFMGDVGTGKTFMSSCIAKEIIEAGKSVVYLNSKKIIEILADYEFNKNNVSYDVAIIYDDIFTCDFLIIDDLGTESINSFSITALFDLINSRLQKGKKMLINTNLDLRDIEEKYTKRLSSRILGNFKIMKFIGEDLRLYKFLNTL